MTKRYRAKVVLFLDVAEEHDPGDAVSACLSENLQASGAILDWAYLDRGPKGGPPAYGPEPDLEEGALEALRGVGKAFLDSPEHSEEEELLEKALGLACERLGVDHGPILQELCEAKRAATASKPTAARWTVDGLECAVSWGDGAGKWAAPAFDVFVEGEWVARRDAFSDAVQAASDVALSRSRDGGVLLSAEQAGDLTAWAGAKTTAWGSAFSAALEVAKDVARRFTSDG